MVYQKIRKVLVAGVISAQLFVPLSSVLAEEVNVSKDEISEYKTPSNLYINSEDNSLNRADSVALAPVITVLNYGEPISEERSYTAPPWKIFSIDTIVEPSNAEVKYEIIDSVEDSIMQLGDNEFYWIPLYEKMGGYNGGKIRISATANGITTSRDLNLSTFNIIIPEMELKLGETFDLAEYLQYIDLIPGASFKIKLEDQSLADIEGNIVTAKKVGVTEYTPYIEYKNLISRQTAESFVVVPNDKVTKVTTQYVDENGVSLRDDVVVDGQVGSEYQTEVKEIEGYTFKELVGDSTGVFTINDKIVTYIYTKDAVKSKGIKVSYEDNDGNKLLKDQELTGDVGEKYETEAKVIEGYTYKEVKGEAKGSFTEAHQQVTYVYTKDAVKSKGITVSYEDADGNKLLKNQELTGNVGEKYETEVKEIKGYTYKEVKGEAKGSFIEAHQKVTYVYIKDVVKSKGITVSYEDAEGNKLTKDQELTGNVGEKYETEAKVIEGYTYKEVKGEAKGNFTEAHQQVTYIYTKDAVKSKGITVSYEDADGNKLLKDQELTGNIGEKYETEVKEIKGYTYKEVKGETKGNFTETHQKVTYVYTTSIAKKKVDKVGEKKSSEYLSEGNKDNKKLPKTGEYRDFNITNVGFVLLILTGFISLIRKRKVSGK